MLSVFFYHFPALLLDFFGGFYVGKLSELLMISVIHLKNYLKLHFTLNTLI